MGRSYRWTVFTGKRWTVLTGKRWAVLTGKRWTVLTGKRWTVLTGKRWTSVTRLGSLRKQLGNDFCVFILSIFAFPKCS